jgi:hypothetical protein
MGCLDEQPNGGNAGPLRFGTRSICFLLALCIVGSGIGVVLMLITSAVFLSCDSVCTNAVAIESSMLGSDSKQLPAVSTFIFGPAHHRIR